MRGAGFVAIVLGLVAIVLSAGPVAIGDPGDAATPQAANGATGPTGPTGPSGPSGPAGPAEPTRPAGQGGADALADPGDRVAAPGRSDDAGDERDEPAGDERSGQTRQPARERARRAPRASVAASRTVTMSGGTNGRFSPRSVSIDTGDSITWDNVDSIPHNAIAVDGEFASPQLVQPGATYSHTFNSAGSFAYACTLHPGMTGTVKVSGSGLGGGGGGSSGSGSGTSSDTTGADTSGDGSGSLSPPPPADSLDTGGSTADDPLSDDTSSGTSESLADTGYEAGSVGIAGAALVLLGLGLLVADRRTRRRPHAGI